MSVIEGPDGGELETAPQVEEHDIDAETQARAASDPKMAGILADLRGERSTRKDLSIKVKELETKAAEADRLAGQMAQMKAQLDAMAPDAEALRRLPPELLDGLRRGKPADPEIPDEEAAATARNYGLYDLQGQPDVNAGRKIQRDMRKLVAEEARRITKAEVEPYRQMSMTQQANYLATLARQRANEGYCDPKVLEQVLATIPLEQQADQNAMNAALVMARGIGGPGTVHESSEPIYLEGSGGRRGGIAQLSDLERRVLRDKGINEKEWQDTTKDYKPGQSFRLE